MNQTAQQSNQDQFWLNVGIMIIIAAVFAAGLYYYQHQQLANLRNGLKDVQRQLAVINSGSISYSTLPTSTPEVSQEKVIRSGTKDLLRIALTFDADMISSMEEKTNSGQVQQWYDPEIIEILNEQEVPATFFLTGLWAETYPEVTKQLARNGLFEIESHSYQTKAFQSCYDLPTLKTKEAKTAAVEKAQQTLKKLTGRTPTYFRFPGGCPRPDNCCYQQQDLKLVNELGLKVVQWNVVSGDAFANNSSNIVNNVLTKTQNGSIVIFHLGGPNAPHTAQALNQIITGLKEQGYHFTTVHSLLNPPTVTNSE